VKGRKTEGRSYGLGENGTSRTVGILAKKPFEEGRGNLPMMKNVSERQIVGVLKQAELGCLLRS